VNFSTPNPLQAIDRTKNTPGMPGSRLKAASPKGQSTSAAFTEAKTSSPTPATWRPGESFSQLLNRQVNKTKPPVEPGPKAGEARRDFLNRFVAPASTGAAQDDTPGADEPARAFLNRRHAITPTVVNDVPAVDGPSPSEAKAANTEPASLNKQKTPDAADAQTQRRQKIEKTAGDLVSNALILPMLKQLRRSPWGENTVFSGGIGEKTFGPEFDIQIADHIAHSPRLGVKAAIASRLMQRTNPDAAMAMQSSKVDVHG
jgi:hypothetical protein